MKYLIATFLYLLSVTVFAANPTYNSFLPADFTNSGTAIGINPSSPKLSSAGGSITNANNIWSGVNQFNNSSNSFSGYSGFTYGSNGIVTLVKPNGVWTNYSNITNAVSSSTPGDWIVLRPGFTNYVTTQMDISGRNIYGYGGTVITTNINNQILFYITNDVNVFGGTYQMVSPTNFGFPWYIANGGKVPTVTWRDVLSQAVSDNIFIVAVAPHLFGYSSEFDSRWDNCNGAQPNTTGDFYACRFVADKGSGPTNNIIQGDYQIAFAAGSGVWNFYGCSFLATNGNILNEGVSADGLASVVLSGCSSDAGSTNPLAWNSRYSCSTNQIVITGQPTNTDTSGIGYPDIGGVPVSYGQGVMSFQHTVSQVTSLGFIWTSNTWTPNTNFLIVYGTRFGLVNGTNIWSNTKNAYTNFNGTVGTYFDPTLTAVLMTNYGTGNVLAYTFDASVFVTNVWLNGSDIAGTGWPITYSPLPKTVWLSNVLSSVVFARYWSNSLSFDKQIAP